MLLGNRSSMIEMHKTEDPDIVSCSRVDRDLRSHAQLHILAAPDNSGVHRIRSSVPYSPGLMQVSIGNSVTRTMRLNGCSETDVLDKGLKIHKTVLKEKAQVRVFGSLFSTGNVGLMTPVIAKGLRKFIDSGRSPNPLPKKRAGEMVEKELAPTRLAPVPPISIARADRKNQSHAAHL